MKGLLSILMLLTGGGLCLAALDIKPPAQKIPIEITADGDNRFEAGMAYAEGNVVVRYGEEVLYADSVTFNQKTRVITAKGNVSIYVPGHIYRGDFLEFNVDTKQVKSLDFRTVQERIMMAGKSLDNPNSKLFIAKDAVLTTENRENPSYRLQASTIELHPDELVVMKNILIKIGEVPIMWLPYAAIPLGDELDNFTFNAGSSSELGFFALVGYSGAIDSRTNISVKSGYYTKRGVPIEAGFEFNPRPGDVGTFKGFYINDQSPDESNAPLRKSDDLDNHRYRLSYQHKYKLSPEFDTTADLNFWSDRYITEDFFEDEFRKERQPDNFADLVYYDPNFTATLLARTRPHFGGRDLFSVTERKPEFTLEFKRQPVGYGLFYEGESSMVNFERHFEDNTRGRNYSAVRYDSFHQLLYPKQYFGWLSVTPRVGARGTVYTRSNSSMNVPVDAGSGEVTRLVLNAGLESSFKVSRVWSDIQDANWGIDGVRHVFQPYLNANFIPEPNETPDEFRGYDTRIPSTRVAPLGFPAFNSIDSIDEQTAIRHGIRNRIQTRRDGLSVDLLSWDLYSQANLVRSPSMGILSDRVYSHAYSELEIHPVPWLTFDSYMALGLASGEMNEFVNTITWQIHPAVDVIFGHEYFYGFDYTDPAYEIPGSRRGRVNLEDENLLKVGSFWRLNENWRVGQNLSFDANNGILREQRYELYRDLRAWELGISAARRNNRVADDEFLAYLTLTLKAFPDAALSVGP